MIKTFVSIWILYWIIGYLSPVEYMYDNVLWAFLIQAAYVILVCIGYLFIIVLNGSGKKKPTNLINHDNKHENIDKEIFFSPAKIVSISLVLSFVGLFFLIIDKIFIQQIDFSNGVAAARIQWQISGIERDGVSSPFSMIGYAIGSMYFVSTLIVILYNNIYDISYIAKTIVFSFLLCLANSILTGGRSILLLYIAFILSCHIVFNKNIFNVMPSKKAILVSLFFIILCFAYFNYIVFARAQLGGVDISTYVIEFLPYLGLEYKKTIIDDFSDYWFYSIYMSSLLVIAYMTHSIATLAAMIENPDPNVVIMFVSYYKILAKLNLISQPNFDWFLIGRFASLPGVLWYQYGILGFSALSLVLGALIGALKLYSFKNYRNIFPAGLVSTAYCILLLSPFDTVVDFLVFPFIITGFLITASIQLVASLMLKDSPALRKLDLK